MNGMNKEMALRGQEATIVGSIQRLNVLEQLAAEEARLEARLAKVRRGQEILQAHPELVELFDIMWGHSF